MLRLLPRRHLAALQHTVRQHLTPRALSVENAADASPTDTVVAAINIVRRAYASTSNAVQQCSVAITPTARLPHSAWIRPVLASLGRRWGFTLLAAGAARPRHSPNDTNANEGNDAQGQD